METIIILNQLQEMGLHLSIIEGQKIKVAPKQKITDEARQMIKQHKTDLLKLLNKPPSPIRAKGYGCGCGHNFYQQVEDFIEEPEDTNWEHQYRLCKVWQCENCKATYEFIGGSKGPQFLN